MARACSKILLFGEHFVVHGSECIAVPVKRYINCTITPASYETTFRDHILKETTTITNNSNSKKSALISLIMEKLNLKGNFNISVEGDIVPSAGMGSSAALSIALIREFSKFSTFEINSSSLIELSFECEKIFHGTPSGIDNTVIVFEKPLKYKKTAEIKLFNPIEINCTLNLALINSGKRQGTKEMILRVKKFFENNQQLKGEMLSSMDRIVADAELNLLKGDLPALGKLMMENQSLLKKIGVSTHNIDRICELSNLNGCYGAKLAGSGGGGIVISLLPEDNKQSNQFFKALEIEKFPYFKTTI